MKKISSKYAEKKRQKRNQWLVGGIMIFLMVISTLGFALQGSFGTDTSESDTNTYNGYEFENVNGFWVLGRFVFAYHPTEVPDIGNLEKSAEDYENLPLYVSSDVLPQAESEIRVNLGQIASSVKNRAYESESETCSDNFIIIKQGNNNEITQNEGCVYITGSSETNTVKITDQFLYKILGIR